MCASRRSPTRSAFPPSGWTRSNKRPLSIFEFELKTWPEFCVIKAIADYAEILQVEDLLHCSFHPAAQPRRASPCRRRNSTPSSARTSAWS